MLWPLLRRDSRSHQHLCPLSLTQVGCFLKTPRFPIWVVCSESHFSVLFSLQPELLQDWRTERLFDLYYYDGLANQQEQIRLTVGATPALRPCASLGSLQTHWAGKPAVATPSGKPESNTASPEHQDWGARGQVLAGPPAGGGQSWALRNGWH